MINEAVYCFYHGVGTREDIDTVMKLGINHPMGLLALADLRPRHLSGRHGHPLRRVQGLQVPPLSPAVKIRGGGVARPQERPVDFRVQVSRRTKWHVGIPASKKKTAIA
jgi:hypothetical protein